MLAANTKIRSVKSARFLFATHGELLQQSVNVDGRFCQLIQNAQETLATSQALEGKFSYRQTIGETKKDHRAEADRSQKLLAEIRNFLRGALPISSRMRGSDRAAGAP